MAVEKQKNAFSTALFYSLFDLLIRYVEGDSPKYFKNAFEKEGIEVYPTVKAISFIDILFSRNNSSATSIRVLRRKC